MHNAGEPPPDALQLIALISTIFIASLIGSLHCAGMCGAFVAFAMGTEKQSAAGHFAAQSAYHGGRLVTYALLGAVAGTLGAALDLTGTVFGLQQAAMILAGVAMVTFGVITLLKLRGVRIPRMPLPGVLTRFVHRGHRYAGDRSPIKRSLIIGLLTTLLPCGWLYAFAVIAAGTGSAATGALTMSVFWLGTVPILASLGIGVQRLAGPLRRHIPAATAVAMVLVGLFSLTGRFNVPALAAEHTEPATLEETTIKAAHVDDVPLPCCQEDP